MNDLHLLFGRGDSALTLFLEAVQNENCLFELDGVDGPVRPAGIVFHHLQHAGATESLQHLGGVMLFTVLCKVQGVTEELPDADRKPHQIFFAAPNPEKWLF